VSLLKIGIAILACYRLAQLVALDDGPYKVMVRFRKELGRRAATGDALWENWAELFHCPFCLGVWFAFPLAIWVGGNSIIGIIIIWLAIAGGQAFLQGVNYDG
jgi:hypothetical protein